jgi:hypothetical protein
VSRAGRLGAAAAAAVAALVLGACATPQAVQPGMTRAAVLESAGRPTRSYALAPISGPGGSEAGRATSRLEYVGLLSQQVWLVDLDGTDHVVGVSDGRAPGVFARIRVDVDDQPAIRRLLGTPDRVDRYALAHLTAWQYPYRDGMWNLEMSVMFDDSGIVRRVESGPDPRFDRGADPRN